jgi:hypothetical protein
MRNTIVLISCGKTKRSQKSRAEALYISERFVKSLRYAKTLTSEEYIFILSAKHGLLPLDKEIEPYDKTLIAMSATEKQDWAQNVLSSLRKVTDIDNDEYVFLTDPKEYSEGLTPLLKHCILPFNGLSSDEMIEWLDGQNLDTKEVI